MNTPLHTMRAVVLNRFGGPDELVVQKVAVPELGPHDVLIRVQYAGVGEWDLFEREGGYADLLGINPTFPYVLGSEGAGSVIAWGEEVHGFHIGDQVYAPGFLNPKGGFYAEYVAVDSQYVSCIPRSISIQEASTISGIGITALRGLEDILKLKLGESIMIFGASGGVGHVAVQLAKNMGAQVFAVASGEDGVAMVKKLGIDAVVDGHKEDISSAACSFAPEGIDAALLTADGEIAQKATQSVCINGRIAYPNGIDPVPHVRPDLRLTGYNGDPDREIIHRLHHHIQSGNLTVHIDQTFLLEEAHKAHLAMNHHYLGKFCLKVNH